MRAGSGEWLIDFAYPEPEPAPVTSIAWRLGHAIVGVLGMRSHRHFGGPGADSMTWAYAGTAEEALQQPDNTYAGWTKAFGRSPRRRSRIPWDLRSMTSPSSRYATSSCTSTAR
ncbi:MAG: hypothetical protein ABR500_08675 [Dermatophilaceae bacterium]